MSASERERLLASMGVQLPRPSGAIEPYSASELAGADHAQPRERASLEQHSQYLQAMAVLDVAEQHLR